MISYTRNGDKIFNFKFGKVLNNIKVIEDWVEYEEKIKHKYNNRLANLYYLTDDKLIRDEIKEIINNSSDINNKIVINLKCIPSGIKGLLYYKVFTAKDNNISISIDSNINEKEFSNTISKLNIKVLYKIINKSFDRAIQEAIQSSKKDILLEIYEQRNKYTITIYNSFKYKNRSIKLPKIHNDISIKHETIDDYHIETISILKTT